MRRRFLPLIYMIPLATLLVRVVWLARFPGDPLAPVDAEGYHLLACNLLAGRGFSMVKDPPFCPASVRVPLYPLFLAGTYGVLGAEPGRAVLVQLLLEVVTAALVMRLAREVAGGRIALLAGLFYAFNGTTQRYVGVLYSEIFLLPLIVVALWTSARALKMTRPCTALAAGALWGLAILTKPNVQYLALAVGGLGFIRFLFVQESRRRAGAAGLAFFGILALVLAPWVVRNRLVFDRWMVSTAFEENLARVSAPATLAEARKLRVAPWTPTWEALYGELLAEASARYDWDARGEYELSCAERAVHHQQIATVAREIIAEHPQAFVVAQVKGVVRSLLQPGHRLWYFVLTGEPWESTGVLDDVWQRMLESLRIGAVGDAFHALWLERVARPPLVASLVWWGLLLARVLLWILGLRGVWRLLRPYPFVVMLLGGSIAYFLFLPGPIAHDRFYFPAIPAVLVLVGAGVLQPLHPSHV